MKVKSYLMLCIFISLVLACSPEISNTDKANDPMTTEPDSPTTIDAGPTETGTIIVDSGDNALLGDLFLISADASGSQKLLDSGDNGYQHFGYADWSPDGSEIVFSALIPPWEIMMAKNDGSNLQSVPNTVGGEYPTWSPEGDRIAFSVWNDGDADILIINRDGSGLINLTENFSANALDPSWSPDGKQIAFFAAEAGEDYEIFTIMVEGSFTAQLTDNKMNDWAPDWSPNGNEIAFLHSTDQDYAEVHVIDLDTGNISERTTAFGYPDLSAEPGLCWMPDGERLVIISQGDVYMSRYDGGVIFDKIWEGKTYTSFPSCH